MTILDNFIILFLIISAFCLGIHIDSRYRDKAAQEQKEALEKQFVRLRANADADDPCRPYGMPRYYQPIPVQPQPEKYVSYSEAKKPIIDKGFMSELKTTGKAKTSFRKSDIAR